MYVQDTIVAPATAPGEAAIAVVRLSGAVARGLAEQFHVRGAPQARRTWYGDYRTHAGSVLDGVIFCWYCSPHSYTGEDVLEICCHGNPLIVRGIVQDLCARGCRMAEPGEFTRRAYLNGRLDLTAAEAVIDAIRARNDRALAAAQDQLRGALGRRLHALLDRLLSACAGLEAVIDFPEEDLPAYDRAARQQEISALAGDMERLAATQRRHVLVHEGVRVVLLGPPNAGKSSLFNRLVGYERAIVNEEPGTTRDFLEERLTLPGHGVLRLFDTAGVREATAAVEQRGVESAWERAEEADLIVLVADASHPAPPALDHVRLRFPDRPLIVVANKIDLAPNGKDLLAGAAPGRVCVSALTGAGMDGLRSALLREADALLASGADEEVLTVNARHADALRRSSEALGRAADLLRRDAAVELAASELREASRALGEITGRVDDESVLDRLFATFCIGK